MSLSAGALAIGAGASAGGGMIRDAVGREHQLSVDRRMAEQVTHPHQLLMQSNQFMHEFEKMREKFGIQHPHELLKQENQHNHELRKMSEKYQRMVEDMKSAGLNPAMMFMQGKGGKAGAMSAKGQAEHGGPRTSTGQAIAQKGRSIRTAMRLLSRN